MTRVVIDNETGIKIDFLKWFQESCLLSPDLVRDVIGRGFGDQELYDNFHQLLAIKHAAVSARIEAERESEKKRKETAVLGRDWREQFHSANDLKCFDKEGGLSLKTSEAKRQWSQGNNTLTKKQVKGYL